MKNIFQLILVLLISTVSYAQYTPTLDGTVMPKGVGVTNAAPTDARSMYYNRTTFTYRAYNSTSEVLSHLNTSIKRTGYFPIYVSESGNIKVYHFLNGTADANLVRTNIIIDSLAFDTSLNVLTVHLDNNSTKTIRLPTGYLGNTGDGIPILKSVNDSSIVARSISVEALSNKIEMDIDSTGGTVIIYGDVNEENIDINNLAGTLGDSKLGTGINANKIGNGSVDNTEFQRINGLTDNIETRLLSKSDTGHTHLSSKITDFQAAVRNSISLTTTGTSGAAAYNPSTGVLNIPQYTGGGGGSGNLTRIRANTQTTNSTTTNISTVVLENGSNTVIHYNIIGVNTETGTSFYRKGIANITKLTTSINFFNDTTEAPNAISSSLSSCVAGVIVNSANVSFRVIGLADSTISWTVVWDSTVVAIPSFTEPTITVSSLDVHLGTYTEGTNSTAQTFTVSGSNLSDDIILTASGTDIELSTNNTTWFSTLTLTETGGSVASTTIYVRGTDNAAVGSIAETIDITSTGADTKVVSVDGDVEAAAPTSSIMKVNIFSTSSGAGTTATTGWNNWGVVTGTNITSSAFNWDDGETSTITATLSSISTINNNGAGYGSSNSTEFPTDCFLITPTQSSTFTLTLNNLPAGTYNIKILASRAWGSSRAMTVTSGATSDAVEAANNYSDVVTLNGLTPNGSNQIALVFNSTVSSNVYCNAFIIEKID